MSKPCKWCGSAEHTQFYCYQKKNKPIAQKLVQLKRTPLKQRGKHAALWTTARQAWFAANPADSYQCHYCFARMPRNMTTLDHLESRSRRPDLRYELENLVPCCWACNTAKGSKSHDEYCGVCVI